jgi:hypothetical protein
MVLLLFVFSLPGLLRFLLLQRLLGQLDELCIKQAPDFNH